MGKNKYLGTILIITVFALDCISGNWLKITGVEAPKTIEEYHHQIIEFLKAKSFFVMVPYLIIALMMFNIKIMFDIADVLMLFICILSCVVNTYDYFDNGNQRQIDIDFVVFGIAIGTILIIKILWMNLQKTTLKTPHW